MARKSVLGKGINALISEYPEPGEGNQRQIVHVSVDDIEPNPHQPRSEFDEAQIEALRKSIEEKGVIQPIAVNRVGHTYQLIAGERRWRAARLAGQETIPSVVYEIDSQQELMEMALIENIQREDLNPIEEAEGYRTLIDSCYLTQETVAKRVGKDRSTITNLMRLLQLPGEIQAYIRQGELQMGHARALLGLDDDDERLDLASRCIEGRLSVREIEKAVKSRLAGGSRGRKKPGKDKQTSPLAPMVASFKEQLQVRFGTAVNIRQSNKKGRIEIEFYGDGDLERILELLLDEA
jgi:ParB family chromosome partitioning protein